MLEEFLDDIITEDVGHELNCVGLDLSEDLIFLIAVRGFELLLDKAGAVLITAELYDVVIDILGKYQ